ncbi:CIA30 family protein [Thalassotalea marina]|uniref:Amidohydrolase n=1 Tax=Thalassotalea marina TaxID=1673741 RepID=A0A919EIT9_9GAMM|nr:CIA30 family protein [Thalassotalea marina]GHF83906.1 hypothetical protein GCM10017161_09040 [Thalassotalea marina]
MATPTIKALSAVIFALSSNAMATELRIDNVKLYQPAEQMFSAPTSIYIEHGNIVKLLPSTHKQKVADHVIDAKGQFAVAGLMDLHVHLGSSGSNYTNFQYLPVEAHFNANLYLGVTDIVDLFSFDNVLTEAKQLQQTQTSPNLFYAGTLFTNPGGHGTQFGGKAYVINQDSDIEALWQQHLATNPHVTKAVIESFGGMGNTLTDTQLAELGKRSKAANLPYFVHVSTLADGKRAIKAGASALAHGINGEDIDAEFIELMLSHNVTYIPTLAVYHNHASESEHQQISHQTELLPVLHKKLQGCLFDKVPEPNVWFKTMWQKRAHAYQNIVKLHKAGVTIATGSDAGNPYTLHGIGLHNEIDALAMAGLANGEIINAATINGATTLAVDDKQGQLAQGYKANFILLNENPLQNINALHHINAVYKEGVKINREQLAERNQIIQPVGQECNANITSQTAQAVIDNFNDKNQWLTVSDSAMGGGSATELVLKDKVLTVKTSLGKPTHFGAWAGTEIRFKQPNDASNFDGVALTYKGSKAPFTLSIYHSEVQDWDHFSKMLPASEDWTTVKVPFSEFKQFGFGNKVQWSAKSITGLNFVWRSMPGTPPPVPNNEFHLKSIGYF